MTVKVDLGVWRHVKLSKGTHYSWPLFYIFASCSLCMHMYSGNQTRTYYSQYAVNVHLQCVYLTCTSYHDRALRAYGGKSNNGTHTCQESPEEPIIAVETHTSCQAWWTVTLQENHLETPLNPHPTCSAVSKGGGWNSRQEFTSHSSHLMPTNWATATKPHWPWLQCSR